MTAGCAVFRKSVFQQIGGFDERLAHCYNDVLFGVRCFEHGLRNIVVCSVELNHHEGAMRPGLTPKELQQLKANGELIRQLCRAPDPYLNSNLTVILHPGGTLLSGLNYDLLNWQPPNENAVTELVVNGSLLMVSEGVRTGRRVMIASAAMGTGLVMLNPGLEIAHSIDLNNRPALVNLLKALGVKRITVSDTSEKAVIQILSGLAVKGISLVLGHAENPGSQG